MSLFSTNFHNKYFPASDRPLQIQNTFVPENAFTFHNHGEVAKIDKDGIMHFTIEASDDNALKFVACIESIIGRKLTGVEVTKKP